jgi:phage tail sheath protein FI
MATSYLSPGVYVEEVSGGSKPIEGVGTSVAGFIGFTEKGPYNTPTLITNWIQFQAAFGGFIDGAYLPLSVYGYFNNGGGVCYVVRLGENGNDNAGEAAAQPAQRLIPARAGTAAGGSLRVTAVGGAGAGVTIEIAAAAPDATPAAERKADGKEKGEAKTEGAPGVEAAEASTPRFTLNVRAGDTQEQFQNVSLRRADARFVETVVNQGRTASKLVRAFLDAESDDESMIATPQLGLFSLESAPPSVALSRIDPSAYIGDAADRTGIGGLDAVDDLTILCAPDLMSAYQRGLIDDEGLRAVQTAMIDHCERNGDRVAIIDSPPGLKPQAIKDWRLNEARYDSSYAALYYPWIQISDPVSGKTMNLPPSGHLAGVWARTDGARGVHKAPANETIAGCIGIDYQTNMQEQTLLNPVGINCVRAFPGRGIRIWGARTLSSDPEWRYLNVRRLFNFVRSSLTIGMQWAVFEPNDPDLWLQLRRDVSSFLTRIYMTGALFGATDREAFFVKCDRENNTRDTIDAGQVIVDIGIAPTKPAEFVIFRIAQYAPGAESA